MENDPLRMTMPELLACVAELEAKYRRWMPLTLTQRPDAPRRDELVRLRASLQGCLAELDRLLADGSSVVR